MRTKKKRLSVLRLAFVLAIGLILAGLVWVVEMGKEYKVTVTNQGKRIRCSDEDKEMLIQLAEEAVEGNWGLLSKVVSLREINQFKKNGTVIEVKYRQLKELPVGSTNVPRKVQEIIFLLGEKEAFLICSGEDFSSVYSVGEVYETLTEWLESKE